jgi:periplasmic divalent cation tolerance protein
MAISVYVTAANAEEAKRIASAAVRERLAACANILGKIRSIYWWDGAVQEEDEVALLLKTREELFEPLAARIKALHSYRVPCIVALPIAAGNPDYLAWIARETA